MRKRNILIFCIFFLCSCATAGLENIEKANAHYQLGVSYLNEDKVQMAYVEFQKAIELDPNNKDVLNALGLIYLRFDDLPKAIDAYKGAIKRSPDYYPSYYGLALCYNAKGQYGDAASAFTRAIELDPFFMGDREKAMKYFDDKRLTAKSEESKEILDYLEIMKY